jgi:hypothetical protein
MRTRYVTQASRQQVHSISHEISTVTAADDIAGHSPVGMLAPCSPGFSCNVKVSACLNVQINVSFPKLSICIQYNIDHPFIEYVLRLEKFSTSVGMVPVNAFPTRMSFFNSVHKPISVGMVPLIPVKRNQTSCNPRR